MRGLLFCLLGAILIVCMSSARAQTSAPTQTTPSQEGNVAHELVVISGGPAIRFFEHGKAASHDVFWGNFINSAEVRLRELQQQKGPGDQVTWLVYRNGYVRRGLEMNEDLLPQIVAKADRLGVALFWFDDKSELINYLNSGKNRSQIPIADFEYFGHSNKACFLFDYSNEFDAMARQFLHANDLVQIHPTDFMSGATAKSWGCHSGEYYGDAWKKQMGFPLIGAIGKTDYSHGGLPFLSSVGGKWNP